MSNRLEFDKIKARVVCSDGNRNKRRIGLWTASMSRFLVLVAPDAEPILLTPDQARDLRDRLDELAAVVEIEHAGIRSAMRGVRA
jgi:hypothetical protein